MVELIFHLSLHSAYSYFVKFTQNDCCVRFNLFVFFIVNKNYRA